LGFLLIESAMKSNINKGSFVKGGGRFIDNYQANKKSTKKGWIFYKTLKKKLSVN